MTAIPYYRVDAFTDHLFGGNPAGVCVLPAFLPDALMLRIAAENRDSETAFVAQRSGSDFDLRWFTSALESDLCGHGTLGAAYVLAIRNHSAWPVRFHTRSGVLSVARHYHGFEMDFPARPPHPAVIPASVLRALGLSTAHTLSSIRDYVVVLDAEDDVLSVSPDLAALAAIDLGAGGTIVTAPAERDGDYVCRYFAPAAGLGEDPATGSIHCTLVPYWCERFGKETLSSRQLSARGGEFRCRLARDRVMISGNATLYLQGTIEV